MKEKKREGEGGRGKTLAVQMTMPTQHFFLCSNPADIGCSLETSLNKLLFRHQPSLPILLFFFFLLQPNVKSIGLTTIAPPICII